MHALCLLPGARRGILWGRGITKSVEVLQAVLPPSSLVESLGAHCVLHTHLCIERVLVRGAPAEVLPEHALVQQQRTLQESSRRRSRLGSRDQPQFLDEVYGNTHNKGRGGVCTVR